MTSIDAHVGALLSKYDETAVEGITSLAAQMANDVAFADAFAAEPHAVGALVGAFSRKCDVAPICESCAQIIRAVSGPSQVALVRALTNGVPFEVIVKLLDRVREDNAAAVVGALHLLHDLFAAAPHVTFRKFQKKIPLNLDVFSETHTSYALRRVREARTKLLLAFVEGGAAGVAISEISSKAILQHGFLTRLTADAPELYASGDPHAQKLVHDVLKAITNTFVVSQNISPSRKRELLASQRNVLKTLIKGLAIAPLAVEVATLLRKLTLETAEPLFDYAVRRDEDDVRMPNHTLFSILRKLNPRHRLVDSHLVVFILHRCPELVRPYLSRAAMHLTQIDRTLSDAASMAATANVLTRIFLLPMPPHIREKLVRLRFADASSSATLYFDLTPTTAGDEIAPKWFHEFVHRMIIKSDNVLHLVFAIQVTEAALRRALELKAIIGEMFNELGAKADEQLSDREDFDAQFDAVLRERLPQREEFWHRATQQLLPMIAAAAATDPAGSGKAQFALQRLYLLMRSYTHLFGIRTSWISAVPAATSDWQAIGGQVPAAKVQSALLRHWEPASITSLCALLVASMSRGVTMPKLHHITLGGATLKGDAAQEARRAPPLLELFVWFCREREHPAPTPTSRHAQLWVCRLFLWVVHSVSMHFGVAIEEVHLWLQCLPPSAAAAFMHLLNAMLQQGLSKAADRIGEQLKSAPSGIIAFSATAFVERTRAKFAEKPPSDPWQLDLRDNLAALEAAARKAAAKWSQRGEIFEQRFGDFGTAKARVTQQERVERTIAHATASQGAQAHRSLVMTIAAFVAAGEVPAAGSSSSSAGPEVEEQLAAVDASLRQVLQGGVNLGTLNIAARVAGSFTEAGQLTPWLRHEVLAWRLLAALRAAPAKDGQPQQPPHEKWKVGLSEAVVANAVAAADGELRAQWCAWGGRGSAASVETASLLALLACLHVAVIGSEGTNAGVERIAAAALAQYTGTLTLRDRLFFAIIAAVDGIQQGGADSKEAAAAVGGDDEATTTSDSDADSSVDVDDGGDRSDPEESPMGSSLASDIDTDDVEPAAADIVAPKRKRTDDKSSASLKGAIPVTPQRPHRKRLGMAVSVRCLPSMQAARFVIGGAAIAPKVTPEADVLAQLAESWTHGELSVHALRFPSACAAEILSRRGQLRLLMSGVWRAVFPEAASAADRRVCDLEHLDSAAPDPRYLSPLVLAVAAARSVGGSGVIAASTLTAFFPFVLRGLSSTKPVMRGVCKDCVALLHPILSPVDRVIANFLRLYVAPAVPIGEVDVQRTRRARARVPSALTAFLIHCVHILREDLHPLHELSSTVFAMPALLTDRAHTFPLGKLLFSFPVSCVSATQMEQHHSELQRQMHRADESALAAAIGRAPPHLAMILRQLHYSCGSVGDARRLQRNGALRTLMLLIGMLPSSSPLRFAAFSCLENLVRSSAHITSTFAGDVVPWCLAHLSQITLETDARQSAEYIVEVLELLDAVYPQYRAGAAVHRQLRAQLLALQATIGRLRVVSSELPVVVRSLLAQMERKGRRDDASRSKRPRNNGVSVV